MGAEAPERPHPSRVRTAFLALVGVVSLAISGGSGFAIYTIHHVEQRVVKLQTDPTRRSTDPNVLPITQTCVNDACNFLVLGSDSRKGITKGFGDTKAVHGQRSDTILLVQVDLRHNRTVVLSIPRDLRVNIPGHGDGKINTAFNFGPNTMVRTVESLTGLKVNHYVEVNFLGFERLVNALGGIPICINRPLIDALAGLKLPKAGCYNLHGGQALAYVRARHIQGDNIPDFFRISRQQQFMRSLISKVLSAGSVFHLPDLIRAVQDNLTLDGNLNLYALQDLTKKLGQLGQRGVAFRIVPSVPVQIGGVDYLQLEEPQAGILFDRIGKGLRLGSLGITAPLTALSPANVTVKVLDAASGGAAQRVAGYLQRAGFVVAPVQQAPSGLTKSQILWSATSATQKVVVSSYLTLFPTKRDSQHATGITVTVVVGPDFPGIEGTP